MATIVQTLDVSTVDEDGKITTFKLDNFKENITKNQVISAFQYGINNGLLMSNYGSAIKSVGTVMKSTSTKIELEGEPIYITPSSIEATLDSSTASKVVEVTVTSQIQAASVMDLQKSDPNSNIQAYVQNISYENNTTRISVYIYMADTGRSATAKLVIVVNGVNNTVPISMTRTL